MDELLEEQKEVGSKARLYSALGIVSIVAIAGLVFVGLKDPERRQRVVDFFDNLKVRNQALLEKLRAKSGVLEETDEV